MTEMTTGATTWLLAGQDLLRSGGIGAVKLHSLTKAAGLTTGSFYHHFGGMPDYLDALAACFGDDQVESHLKGTESLEPRDRIVTLMAMARERKLIPLDAAMRDWAGSSSAAAKAVEAVDHRLLEYLTEAFAELGYSGRAGQVRAQLLVSSGVARVIAPWPPSEQDLDDVLDILAP